MKNVKYKKPESDPVVDKISYRIHKEICTACAGCASVCPVQAISVTNNSAEILSTCTRCGNCYAFCPVDAVEKIEDK